MNAMDTSARIRYLRKKNELTLEQVAEKVGVRKSTVQKWESGAIDNMRRDKIAKLAVALYTTPAYLMCWSDDESITLIESGISSAGAIRYFPHLKEEREKRNITTATVALSLGIREEDYVRIESGSHLPTVDILYKLSVFFCCSVEYMLGVDSFVPSPSFSPSSADRDLVIAYHAAPPEKQEEIRFSLRNYMRNDSTAQKMA